MGYFAGLRSLPHANHTNNASNTLKDTISARQIVLGVHLDHILKRKDLTDCLFGRYVLNVRQLKQNIFAPVWKRIRNKSVHLLKADAYGAQFLYLRIQFRGLLSVKCRLLLALGSRSDIFLSCTLVPRLFLLGPRL